MPSADLPQGDKRFIPFPTRLLQDLSGFPRAIGFLQTFFHKSLVTGFIRIWRILAKYAFILLHLFRLKSPNFALKNYFAKGFMKLRIFLGLLVLFLGIIIGFAIFYGPIFFEEPESKPVISSQEEKETPLPVVAVVVENLPEARPQFGLALADIVFETLTESGITRFLAFFGTSDVSKIGPVRSVRPYFLDWVKGFGVPIAFSGGSAEALELIEGDPALKDINEFYNEKTFWREQSRPAPHNLFTATKPLQDLIRKKNWTAPTGNLGWKTKMSSTPAQEALLSATKISIDFSTIPSFAVTYEYDPQTNNYKRFIAGKADLDSLTKIQIAPQNVVIMYTTSKLLDEKLLTISLETLGSGKALIFRDGKIIQARWKKESPGATLKLVDADGSLITLNEGSVWFAVTDQFGSVSWE